MKYPIDLERELQEDFYPPMPRPYGMPPAKSRKFNPPITPRENFELFRQRKLPVWAVNFGMDVQTIQPMCMPDASARSFGGIDWFGIDWEFEPKSNAAMVRPGTRRLSDISKWREEIIWPDLNDIDWQKNYDETYRDTLSADRPVNFVIVNGLFERTADLTSFSDAFMYLLTDAEELTAFYVKLREWHMELIKIARDIYGADIITFHDDMGSQRASFMSPETFREVMLPHYQYINDECHKMGLTTNFHSCGSVGNLLPLYIEAGWDMWEGQASANDMHALAVQYIDKLAFENFMRPAPGATDEEIKAEIDKRLTIWGKDGRYLISYMDVENPDSVKKWQEYIYARSRELYGS